MGDARRRMEASRAMAVLDEKFIVDDDLVIVELGANENWLAVGDSESCDSMQLFDDESGARGKLF
jgi:hypothetical protein